MSAEGRSCTIAVLVRGLQIVPLSSSGIEAHEVAGARILPDLAGSVRHEGEQAVAPATTTSIRGRRLLPLGADKSHRCCCRVLLVTACDAPSPAKIHVRIVPMVDVVVVGLSDSQTGGVESARACVSCIHERPRATRVGPHDRRCFDGSRIRCVIYISV